MNNDIFVLFNRFLCDYYYFSNFSTTDEWDRSVGITNYAKPPLIIGILEFRCIPNEMTFNEMLDPEVWKSIGYGLRECRPVGSSESQFGNTLTKNKKPVIEFKIEIIDTKDLNNGILFRSHPEQIGLTARIDRSNFPDRESFELWRQLQ